MNKVLIETWPKGASESSISEGTVEEALKRFAPEGPLAKVWQKGQTVYITGKDESYTEALFGSKDEADVFVGALDRLSGNLPWVTNSYGFIPAQPSGLTRVRLGERVRFVGADGIEVGDALYTVLPKYSVPENGDWAISCGTAFTGRVRITVHPSVLVGKRIVSVSGLKEGSETVEIVTDGGTAKIGHERKCCEHIGLMDHTGEAKDLVGRVIRSAEVVFGGAGEDETFYEIKTDGSDLWLRFGDVNDDSRYGVEVDFAWEPV